MPASATNRALRLSLIALYTLAAMMFAAAMPTHGVDQLDGVRLPTGEIATFCHTDSGLPQPAHDSQHRNDCCATCVMAAIPGLAAGYGTDLQLPLAGEAVEAGIVRAYRTALWRADPVSRGPPRAAL